MCCGCYAALVNETGDSYESDTEDDEKAPLSGPYKEKNQDDKNIDKTQANTADSDYEIHEALKEDNEWRKKKGPQIICHNMVDDADEMD